MVVITRILASEPSVVHHEQFSAHGRNISHHLVHTLLVDIEIYALPTVEQHVAQLVSVGQLIASGPVMESTAHAAFTLQTVSHGKLGRGKSSLGRQFILRSLVIDAGHELQGSIGGTGLNRVVAAPCQHTTENGSVFFRRFFAAYGNHDGRIVCLRIPHTFLVGNYFLSVGQTLFFHFTFGPPGSMKMCHPVLPALKRHKGRSKPAEHHGFALFVCQLRPRTDNVRTAISLEVLFRLKRVDLVTQRQFQQFTVAHRILPGLLQRQIDRHVSVGMRHQQSFFAIGINTESRIAVGPQGQPRIGHRTDVACIQARPVIQHISRTPLLGINYK